MDLRGWVRTSLIDYPGHIATVLFTAGCDFRCPMCHNADLVLRPGQLPTIDEAALWDFLKRRVGKLTGVVVTGGEPMLQPGLPEFLKELHALGYAVKLDTNGYRPDALAALLADGVVDYVAMDVKALPESYARLTGVPGLDVGRIEASLALLAHSAVACEFRTTVVPGMLDEDDIEAIARWIASLSDRRDIPYHLQQFRSMHTLDPALADAAPYDVQRLQAMAERARRWLDDVRLRGV